MFGLVGAVLAAGATICSGVEVAGPLKTIKITQGSKMKLIVKSLQSTGLVVDTKTVPASIIAIDTTGGRNQQAARIAFDGGKVTSIIFDTMIVSQTEANLYALNRAAYYESITNTLSKTTSDATAKTNATKISYSCPPAYCQNFKYSIFCTVTVHYRQDGNRVITIINLL